MMRPGSLGFVKLSLFGIAMNNTWSVVMYSLCIYLRSQLMSCVSHRVPTSTNACYDKRAFYRARRPRYIQNRCVTLRLVTHITSIQYKIWRIIGEIYFNSPALSACPLVSASLGLLHFNLVDLSYFCVRIKKQFLLFYSNISSSWQ